MPARLPAPPRSLVAGGQPRWDFARVPISDHSRQRPRPPPRLTLGEPGDAHEREADDVAERVMRGEPVTAALGDAGTTVRRACAACDKGGDDEEKVRAHPAAGGLAGGLSADTAAGIEGARGGGAALDGDARAYFEPRFGHSFADVRVHADQRAGSLASAIGARAFTVGRDIFFGEGEYRPSSPGARRLLAHELTHVVQGSNSTIRRDLAVEPTAPGTPVRTLTAAEVQAAITFNRARHTDATEISLMRDILGIDPTPAVIDADFVQAVLRYQAEYGDTQDGKLGQDTATRLAREVTAEAAFLGAGNEGTLGPALGLKTRLRALLDANNANYADYRTEIRAATMLQRSAVLVDDALVLRLQTRLTWVDWADCAERLGRPAQTASALLVEIVRGCDGGLGLWALARAANRNVDPIVTVGPVAPFRGSVTVHNGTIRISRSFNLCSAAQTLVQELSNLSRAADLRQVDTDAATGSVSREDYIRRIERIEFETGVSNVLAAFDACSARWGCAAGVTSEKEWARAATDFDDYFNNLLNNLHKEHYGTFWDATYQAAFRRAHPPARP